jgi:hypothetical protein
MGGGKCIKVFIPYKFVDEFVYFGPVILINVHHI